MSKPTQLTTPRSFRLLSPCLLLALVPSLACETELANDTSYDGDEQVAEAGRAGKGDIVPNSGNNKNKDKTKVKNSSQRSSLPPPPAITDIAGVGDSVMDGLVRMKEAQEDLEREIEELESEIESNSDIDSSEEEEIIEAAEEVAEDIDDTIDFVEDFLTTPSGSQGPSLNRPSGQAGASTSEMVSRNGHDGIHQECLSDPSVENCCSSSQRLSQIIGDDGWEEHNSSSLTEDQCVFTFGGLDRVFAGEGTYFADMGSGDDMFYGEPSGSSVVFGRDGSDRIYGSSSNDWLIAGEGNNDVTGGAGDDYIQGGSGHDCVWAGEGDDEIRGGAGVGELIGDEGNDTIYGGPDDDRLWGCEDDDVLHGNGGNDVLVGGAGNDQIFAGPTGVSFLDGMEGDDILVGGPGGSSDYPERLIGRSGNDSIFPGPGTSHVWGESGDDTVTYTACDIVAGDYHRVDGGSGYDTLVIPAPIDELAATFDYAGFENIVVTNDTSCNDPSADEPSDIDDPKFTEDYPCGSGTLAVAETHTGSILTICSFDGNEQQGPGGATIQSGSQIFIGEEADVGAEMVFDEFGERVPCASELYTFATGHPAPRELEDACVQWKLSGLNQLPQGSSTPPPPLGPDGQAGAIPPTPSFSSVSSTVCNGNDAAGTAWESAAESFTNWWRPWVAPSGGFPRSGFDEETGLTIQTCSGTTSGLDTTPCWGTVGYVVSCDGKTDVQFHVREKSLFGLGGFTPVLRHTVHSGKAFTYQLWDPSANFGSDYHYRANGIDAGAGHRYWYGFFPRPIGS